jgi:hypothetical protein
MWCIKEKLLYKQCVTSLEAFKGPPALPKGSFNQYKANTSIADIAMHKNRSYTKYNQLNSRPPKRLYNTQSQSQSINKRPRRDPSPSLSKSSFITSNSLIPLIDPYLGHCYYYGRKGYI